MSFSEESKKNIQTCIDEFVLKLAHEIKIADVQSFEMNLQFEKDHGFDVDFNMHKISEFDFKKHIEDEQNS